MTVRDACPSKAAFARALKGESSDPVHRHLTRCPKCAKKWEAHRRLLEIALAMPGTASAPERARRVHDALIEQAAASASRKRVLRRSVAWVAAAAVLLGGGGYLYWSGGISAEPPKRQEPQLPETVYRASVHPTPGAEYRLVAHQPDEIVRLFDGTLTVSVEPLHQNERFRVMTGDAAVEVRGTVFDVTASADRLVAVRVLSGTVEVRPSGETATILGPDQRWHAGGPDADPADASTNDDPRVSASKPHGARSPGGKTPRGGRRPDPEREVSSEAEVLFNHGWGRLRRGDFDGAASAFEEVLSATEETTLKEDAAYWLAIAHLRADHTALAERAMTRFLAQYPKGRQAAEISVKLGWIELDTGRLESARRHFLSASESGNPRTRRSAEQGLVALEQQQAGKSEAQAEK